MKSIILSLLMVTAIFAFEVVEHKLPKSNKIIFKFVFKNGSISDPSGKEGLTYLTASMLTEGGAGKLSYSDIQDKIYPMAATYGSSVDKEVTILTFQVHKDWVEKFYPIMIDILLNPQFDKFDFQRLKMNQQVYVDQVIRASSDEEYSKKALEDFMFRGTKYQHMIEGKTASVAGLTLADVKDHYKKAFTQNNLTVGIAGNYSASILSKLKKDLSKLSKERPMNFSSPKLAQPDGIQVEIIAKDNAFGSAIFTGEPLNLTRANDDFAALMIANSYLGEHRKSYGKLYQQLRETRSMNYGDYSYIEWYKNGGSNMLPPSGVPRFSNYFALWIRPVQIAKQLKTQYDELKDIKLGHAHYSLRMALYEVDKLIKQGMSAEDFEATRAFLKSYIKLYVKSPSEQLGYLLDSKFYGRKNYIQELDNMLTKLTVEDVNKAIKKYWNIDNMYVTIVTDKSEADELAKSLMQNTPSPMTYSNVVKAGLPKQVLQEDALVANFRINVKNVKVVNSADTFK